MKRPRRSDGEECPAQCGRRDLLSSRRHRRRRRVGGVPRQCRGLARRRSVDGWNRSGDMGHRDEDGWLYFDYRIGGGIRHNGDFVNPELRREGDRRGSAGHPTSSSTASPPPRELPARRTSSRPSRFGSRSPSIPSRPLRPLPQPGLEPNFVPSHSAAGRGDPQDRIGEAPGALPAGSLRAPGARRLRPGLAKLSPCASSGWANCLLFKINECLFERRNPLSVRYNYGISDCSRSPGRTHRLHREGDPGRCRSSLCPGWPRRHPGAGDRRGGRV